MQLQAADMEAPAPVQLAKPVGSALVIIGRIIACIIIIC